MVCIRHLEVGVKKKEKNLPARSFTAIPVALGRCGWTTSAYRIPHVCLLHCLVEASLVGSFLDVEVLQKTNKQTTVLVNKCNDYHYVIIE